MKEIDNNCVDVFDKY